MGRYGGPDGDKLFGDEMLLIAELHIEYATGEKEIIVTNDNWEYCGSDIAEANIYDGEVFNRKLWENRENIVKKANVVDKSTNSLIDRISLPVIAKEILTVKDILHTPNDEIVLDFGQNHSGMIFFMNKLPDGTKVTFEHGEVLQNGCFYNENYRSAKAAFVYTSDGREELVRPHFTFYGFRYVRVTGWPTGVDISEIKSMVLFSDIKATGHFDCNNEKINRLFQNTEWGLKSNFIDMPTDCPQRDERLGWTGDAQVFCPTANLHMNSKIFYEKYLRDLRNYQLKEDGAVPSSIPMIGGMNLAAAVWGDAAAIIPMHLYRTYKDKIALGRHYGMMKDWIEYIHSNDSSDREPHYLYDFGFQWGDWLALDGTNEQSTKGGTEDAFVASVYYYNSVLLVAQAAEVLNLTEDANTYFERADRIRVAILDEYFAPSGRLCIDTQTAYIISLYFGVYRNKEIIVEHLKLRLGKDKHKLTGGFVGAPLMCKVLAENGLSDEAYNMLFNEEYPGWLYAVNLGATTIWERWNSLLPGGTISGTDMNSLNHYAYGSIARFLYENVAGIQRLEDGYRSVHFNPQINNHLTTVAASYESPCGLYEIAWEIMEDGKVKVKITVPFGCSAKVTLPRSDIDGLIVESGRHEFEYVPKTPFVGKTLETMTVGELISHKSVSEYIQVNAYPLTALAESNGHETMMMPAKLAIETAVNLAGLNPLVAAEIESLFLEYK